MTSLFMHFSLTVHPPDSVCSIYLTSHALCGWPWKKRILKTQGNIFSQPIQPNLWTVLIDDFLSFFKEKCLSLTLPNETPKESLKATGYAVFWYNCTVFLHFVCHFLKQISHHSLYFTSLPKYTFLFFFIIK